MQEVQMVGGARVSKKGQRGTGRSRQRAGMGVRRGGLVDFGGKRGTTLESENTER